MQIPWLFPDFSQYSFISLTFNKIPWLFPDFCQVWNFPDFSLTTGHPVCASSQTPRWIQTAVAVRKHSIGVKIGDILPRVTLKFTGWPWKTIGILFYVTLSFVHHFKAIGEFKLKLQSGNAQFGPKWAIFCPLWPENLMDNLEKQ